MNDNSGEKEPQSVKNNDKCSNKQCPQNLYQNGLEDEKDFCEVCAAQFKSQSYCVYCKQIYFENTDDGKAWIQCDECNRWVHAECADLNIYNMYKVNNQNVNFKCIRCKKMGKDGPQRRANYRTGGKGMKKTDSGVLYSIGFQWALKPEEIAEDLKKIQSYLK